MASPLTGGTLPRTGTLSRRAARKSGVTAPSAAAVGPRSWTAGPSAAAAAPRSDSAGVRASSVAGSLWTASASGLPSSVATASSVSPIWRMSALEFRLPAVEAARQALGGDQEGDEPGLLGGERAAGQVEVGQQVGRGGDEVVEVGAMAGGARPRSGAGRCAAPAGWRRRTCPRGRRCRRRVAVRSWPRRHRPSLPAAGVPGSIWTYFWPRSERERMRAVASLYSSKPPDSWISSRGPVVEVTRRGPDRPAGPGPGRRCRPAGPAAPARRPARRRCSCDPAAPCGTRRRRRWRPSRPTMTTMPSSFGLTGSPRRNISRPRGGSAAAIVPAAP